MSRPLHLDFTRTRVIETCLSAPGSVHVSFEGLLPWDYPVSWKVETVGQSLIILPRGTVVSGTNGSLWVDGFHGEEATHSISLRGDRVHFNAGVRLDQTGMTRRTAEVPNRYSPIFYDGYEQIIFDNADPANPIKLRKGHPQWVEAVEQAQRRGA
jgi:hypothetical protein